MNEPDFEPAPGGGIADAKEWVTRKSESADLDARLPRAALRLCAVMIVVGGCLAAIITLASAPGTGLAMPELLLGTGIVVASIAGAALLSAVAAIADNLIAIRKSLSK